MLAAGAQTAGQVVPTRAGRQRPQGSVAGELGRTGRGGLEASKIDRSRLSGRTVEAEVDALSLFGGKSIDGLECRWARVGGVLGRLHVSPSSVGRQGGWLVGYLWRLGAWVWLVRLQSFLPPTCMSAELRPGLGSVREN